MNKKTEILITEPLDGLPKQFIKDNNFLDTIMEIMPTIKVLKKNFKK